VPYLCRHPIFDGRNEGPIVKVVLVVVSISPEMSGLPAAEAGALLDWCEETIQETERRARRGAEG
jgi:hypothetical protein